MSRTSAGPLFRSVKRWLHDQLVGEVPDDLALCEFDCRKRQCRQGEWETCERRQRFQQMLQGEQDDR